MRDSQMICQQPLDFPQFSCNHYTLEAAVHFLSMKRIPIRIPQIPTRIPTSISVTFVQTSTYVHEILISFESTETMAYI